MPAIKNSWFYFPKRKGLITGIILTSYGIFGLLLNIASNLIINPQEEDPNPLDLFYSQQIADNIPKFLIIFGSIFIIIGIFCIIFIFPFKDEDVRNDAKRKLIYLQVKIDI